ncbi:hypothetical protein C9374_007086 [Naegleria lovaniensis]|uniref:Uncharacterized protein n=1 Tax=Naegleria lovaniensis TaxID=51637 RepID=A0AA88H2M1_NAELO|nr:uncharacterized protein C9374_007086 [Naegleria lovaniensis]KAG2393555.1 hypothetical protein C9374_007086 [Naegleria lovaniensis]
MSSSSLLSNHTMDHTTTTNNMNHNTTSYIVLQEASLDSLCPILSFNNFDSLVLNTAHQQQQLSNIHNNNNSHYDHITTHPLDELISSVAAAASSQHYPTVQNCMIASSCDPAATISNSWQQASVAIQPFSDLGDTTTTQSLSSYSCSQQQFLMNGCCPNPTTTTSPTNCNNNSMPFLPFNHHQQYPQQQHSFLSNLQQQHTNPYLLLQSRHEAMTVPQNVINQNDLDDFHFLSTEDTNQINNNISVLDCGVSSNHQVSDDNDFLTILGYLEGNDQSGAHSTSIATVNNILFSLAHQNNNNSLIPHSAFHHEEHPKDQSIPVTSAASSSHSETSSSVSSSNGEVTSPISQSRSSKTSSTHSNVMLPQGTTASNKDGPKMYVLNHDVQVEDETTDSKRSIMTRWFHSLMNSLNESHEWLNNEAEGGSNLLEMTCEPNGFTENNGTCRPRGSKFSVFVNDCININMTSIMKRIQMVCSTKNQRTSHNHNNTTPHEDLESKPLHEIFIEECRVELCSYLDEDDSSEAIMVETSEKLSSVVLGSNLQQQQAEDFEFSMYNPAVVLQLLIKRDNNNKRSAASRKNSIASNNTSSASSLDKKGRKRKKTDGGASKKVCFVRLILQSNHSDDDDDGEDVIVLAKSDNFWARSKTRQEMERKKDRALAQKRKKSLENVSLNGSNVTQPSNSEASSSDDLNEEDSTNVDEEELASKKKKRKTKSNSSSARESNNLKKTSSRTTNSRRKRSTAKTSSPSLTNSAVPNFTYDSTMVKGGLNSASYGMVFEM